MTTAVTVSYRKLCTGIFAVGNLSGFAMTSNKRLLSTCNHVARPNRQFTVAVEGNIGSGKTLFLEYFKKNYPEAGVIEEPVELWRNVKGHNLLNLLYKDSTRWSLTFQTYVQLTMVRTHLAEIQKPASVKLMERSLYSAKYCFVENLFRESKMPEAEYVVLSEWFDWLIQNLDIHLDLIVYLRTSPEVVYDRVKKRYRSEEQLVPLQYLENLHQLHEDWLYRRSCFALPCPVLTLDGNLPKEELVQQYEKYKRDILLQTDVVSPVICNVSEEKQPAQLA